MKITFISIILLLLLTGCQTIPYESLSLDYPYKPTNEFQSLSYALINDVLDLIPDEISDTIQDEHNINEIMVGIGNPGPKALPSFSIERRNLGSQVAYIVLLVYGNEIKNITIPQSIYYTQEDSDKNINMRIKNGLYLIKKNPVSNSQRDLYNLALNIIIDLWIMDFSKKGFHAERPNDGVYLRDSQNNLYPYKDDE